MVVVLTRGALVGSGSGTAGCLGSVLPLSGLLPPSGSCSLRGDSFPTAGGHSSSTDFFPLCRPCPSGNLCPLRYLCPPSDPTSPLMNPCPPKRPPWPPCSLIGQASPPNGPCPSNGPLSPKASCPPKRTSWPSANQDRLSGHWPAGERLSFSLDVTTAALGRPKDRA